MRERRFLSVVVSCFLVFILGGPALADLDVDVSPTPELGVEKTYTITVVNDGDTLAEDITFPTLFNLDVTIAESPSAEYFAYIGESYDEGVTIYVMSLKDGSFGANIAIPSIHDAEESSYKGFALHPSTGQLYAIINNGPDCLDRCLWTINLATKTAELVGSSGSSGIVTLGIDAAGRAWTMGGDDESAPYQGEIFRIKLSNGSITVPTATFGTQDAQSMAFNPDDGLMYFTSAEDFHKFDPDVGISSVVTIATDLTEPTTGNAFDIGALTYIGDGKFLAMEAVGTDDICLIDTTGNVTRFADNNTSDTVYFRGVVSSGADKSALACSGTGADKTCSIPKLISGGKVIVTVKATVYEKPTASTTDDETDPSTDPTDATDATTDTSNGKGGGGCTVAGNADTSADYLMLMLASGLMLGLRRVRRSA